MYRQPIIPLRFGSPLSPDLTVKSGNIVLSINNITSLTTFLASPVLVNMRDIEILQKQTNHQIIFSFKSIDKILCYFTFLKGLIVFNFDADINVR